MSYFNKEERFNELFDDWFDNSFRKYLAANRKLDGLYCLVGKEYQQGMCAAYAAIDDWIDQSIEQMRREVDREFEEWKEEQKELGEL